MKLKCWTSRTSFTKYVFFEIAYEGNAYEIAYEGKNCLWRKFEIAYEGNDNIFLPNNTYFPLISSAFSPHDFIFINTEAWFLL